MQFHTLRVQWETLDLINARWKQRKTWLQWILYWRQRPPSPRKTLLAATAATTRGRQNPALSGRKEKLKRDFWTTSGNHDHEDSQVFPVGEVRGWRDEKICNHNVGRKRIKGWVVTVLRRTLEMKKQINRWCHKRWRMEGWGKWGWRDERQGCWRKKERRRT